MDLVCFFLQAEDGIRYAKESRGLGDVYKRQSQAIAARSMLPRRYGRVINIGSVTCVAGYAGLAPVSYTHLTLPTIYSV